MFHKRKRANFLIPKKVVEYLKRMVDAIVFAFMIVSLASSVSFVVVTVIQSVGDSSDYRFCLATETSDSCVHRPGIVFGDKSSASPDKLLSFFSGIPGRVQRKWRVWVKDLEHLETTEMTVAEFYSWIESVWNPLREEARM